MFIVTINCGMQYKPLLATGLSCLSFLPFLLFLSDNLYSIKFIKG